MTIETRFGPYGGRFVPETLMPGARRADGGLRGGARRRGLPGRARVPPARLRRPPHAALPRRAADASAAARRIFLKREDLCHTGAHKINNVARPGAAREAHGQAARHRRDRRRPARRRHRHRLRPARPRVRRLHGRGGHAPPGAERLPHAAARRRRSSRSTTGSRTLKDAINEAMRDWVTNVRDDLLRHRLGRRARTRTPRWCATSRPSSARDARADARAVRRTSPMRSSPASAAAPTRWASSTPSATSRPCG